MTESDVTIRDGADVPGTTKVDTIQATQLEKPCAHELVVWRIGLERWHQVRVENGHPMLEACRPTQLRLPAAKA